MSVLVVGAGPTGLTAAVELARRGVPVTLIEKRDGASNLSRAVGISAASMRIFEASGVRVPIEAEAIPFRGIVFHRGPAEVARFPLNFDAASRLWGLPQDRTEHHLAAAFVRLGGQVRYGAAFEGLRQDADGVVARFGGDEARFDHVIGADGVRSAVRDALGLPFPGHEVPGRWSIADVAATGWRDPDWFSGFLLPGRDVVVVVPMAPGRFRVIASRADALAALPVPMEVTRVNRTSDFRISVRQAPAMRVGRVVLAGDAAHCHSPVGGRGMNLGIADAADLARRIAGGDVAGYEAARRPVASAVIRGSEAARRAIQSGPAGRAALVAAMRGVAAVTPLARALMRRAAGGAADGPEEGA